MYNKNIKIAYIVIGVYMLLYLTLPIRRTVYVWQGAQSPLFSFLVEPGQYIVMMLITLFAVVNLPKPYPLFDKLVQPKVLIVAAYVVLPACLILFTLHITGLWWTWSTVGLHFGSVVLIALLLRNKVPASTAFFFACGCAFVAIGVWEIIYKYGFWYFNDSPQNIGITTFWGQFKFMAPFVFFGLVVLIPYLLRHRNLVHLNTPTLACFILLIGAFTYWFASGFWCDILFDWSTRSWGLNPESNYTSMAVYRSSKVWLNLMFASTVWTASIITVPFWRRQLCMQLGHCKKGENDVS